MNNSFQVKAADAFVTCGDFTASVCRLRNTSAVSIDYQVGEVTTELAAGAASGAINVSNSTCEVSVRRSDLNSSAVSVLIEWGLTADEAYELASAEVDPVSAADITDASATGISVLTGTAAQARTALEVGAFAVASKSDAYTIGTDSADELLGGVVYVTASAVMTLPAVSAGKRCTIIAIGAVAVTITPDASDRIILDGVALADGASVVSKSLAGDVAHVTYESADGWHISTNGWSAAQ